MVADLIKAFEALSSEKTAVRKREEKLVSDPHRDFGAPRVPIGARGRQWLRPPEWQDSSAARCLLGLQAAHLLRVRPDLCTRAPPGTAHERDA